MLNKLNLLLRMPKNEIDKGIYEISKKYYNQIIFRDRLICLIYKN